MYSNDHEKGYDRFAILNDPEDTLSWTILASELVQYAKFKHSPYTFLLWEPDGEKEFNDYSRYYLTSSAGAHGPGFRFAINIDPVMFALYSSASSKQALSQHMEEPFTVVGMESLSSGLRITAGNSLAGMDHT